MEYLASHELDEGGEQRRSHRDTGRPRELCARTDEVSSLVHTAEPKQVHQGASGQWKRAGQQALYNVPFMNNALQLRGV
jgi:hypothetical protein